MRPDRHGEQYNRPSSRSTWPPDPGLCAAWPGALVVLVQGPGRQPVVSELDHQPATAWTVVVRVDHRAIGTRFDYPNMSPDIAPTAAPNSAVTLSIQSLLQRT